MFGLIVPAQVSRGQECLWGVANPQLWAGGTAGHASASSPEGTARRCTQGCPGVLEGRSEAHRWAMLRCSSSWLPHQAPRFLGSPPDSSSKAFFWAPQSKDPDEATLTSVRPAPLSACCGFYSVLVTEQKRRTVALFAVRHAAPLGSWVTRVDHKLVGVHTGTPAPSFYLHLSVRLCPWISLLPYAGYAL